MLGNPFLRLGILRLALPVSMLKLDSGLQRDSRHMLLDAVG